MTTALITGASSGLGAIFAEQLAAQGNDLILTARRAERLETLATELRAKHGIAIDVIPADLATAGAPAALIAGIAQRGLAVHVLINNAGFGARGAFAGIDRDTQASMIDLNCRALMELCHAVLPGMIQMRAGGILNVASTASFQPGPWMAVYYATKAFVLSFSEALHEEVREQGVRVAALCPGPTRTEFAEVANMGDSALFEKYASDPESVVRDGLKALTGNQAVRVSGAMNKMTAGSIRFLPRWAARRIAGSLQKARQA
jgi:short-subunit dehydrogenase